MFWWRFVSFLVGAMCAGAPMIAHGRPPVVVIPGLMGSKLCDNKGQVIWGDRNSFQLTRINVIRLPANVEQRDRTIANCGLIDRVSVVPWLWESDVYDGLIKSIKANGYRDEEIFIFDYDWRLSNFETAAALKAFIEVRSPNEKVNIVAHSMGGIVARIYIQELGGGNRVNNVLFLGTPHRGSARVFERLKEGLDHGPSKGARGFVDLQRTILSFPSTFQLLPFYEECCGFSSDANPVSANYFDVLDVDNWRRFSWLPSELRDPAGLEALRARLADAKRLKALVHKPIFSDPIDNARLHFIGNGFVETWSRVFFDPQSGAITGSSKFPGDGTVLLFSATNGEPSRVQISLKEHESIFSGREPELVLAAALSGRTFHRGGGGFLQTIVDQRGNQFDASSIGIRISARAVVPNEELTVDVNLAGSGIEQAELSNLSVSVLRDGATLLKASHSKVGVALDRQTRQASFRVPSESGAYKVRIAVQGMEPVETVFAVVDP